MNFNRTGLCVLCFLWISSTVCSQSIYDRYSDVFTTTSFCKTFNDRKRKLSIMVAAFLLLSMAITHRIFSYWQTVAWYKNILSQSIGFMQSIPLLFIVLISTVLYWNLCWPKCSLNCFLRCYTVGYLLLMPFQSLQASLTSFGLYFLYRCPIPDIDTYCSQSMSIVTTGLIAFTIGL